MSREYLDEWIKINDAMKIRKENARKIAEKVLAIEKKAEGKPKMIDDEMVSLGDKWRAWIKEKKEYKDESKENDC